jgi:AcrR family transcriptional regulator
LFHTFVLIKILKVIPKSETADLPEVHPAQTRTAILNAAEELFAARGFEGASVRDITREAKSNLGAINYHFGSKIQLVAEVFTRRIAPLNRARIELLDRLEAAAGETAPPLEAVLEALFRPAVAGDKNYLGVSQAFIQLMCRAFQEPNPELSVVVKQCFNELVARFDAAIRRAVPDLPQPEMFWTMSFTMGALHHTLDLWVRFDWIPKAATYDEKPPVTLDREGLIQRLIAYTAAGIRAQAALP